MKIRILFLGLLAFIAYACTVNDSENIDDQDITPESEINEYKLADGSANGNSALNYRYSITPGGNSTITSSQHYFSLNRLNPRALECLNKGCETLVTPFAGDLKSVDLNEEDLLSGELVKYVGGASPALGASPILISQVVVEDYNDLRIVVYDYLDADEDTKTVMFAVKKQGNATLGRFISDPPNPVVIDCGGGCNDENASCRESYNLGTGSVSCTCEGECDMTIGYEKK